LKMSIAMSLKTVATILNTTSATATTMPAMFMPSLTC
jgi:hypothetical protein